jgi:hypothetical protein
MHFHRWRESTSYIFILYSYLSCAFITCTLLDDHEDHRFKKIVKTIMKEHDKLLHESQNLEIYIDNVIKSFKLKYPECKWPNTKIRKQVKKAGESKLQSGKGDV